MFMCVVLIMDKGFWALWVCRFVTLTIFEKSQLLILQGFLMPQSPFSLLAFGLFLLASLPFLTSL